MMGDSLSYFIGIYSAGFIFLNVFLNYVSLEIQSIFIPQNFKIMLFTIGLLFQDFIVLFRFSEDLKSFLQGMALFFIFVAFLASLPVDKKLTEGYNFPFKLLIFALIFALMDISLILYNRVIPKISEIKAMMFFALNLYICISVPWLHFLAPLSILFFIAAVFYAFKSSVPSRKLRLCFYIWYMITLILFFVVLWQNFIPSFFNEKLSFRDIPKYLFLGMSFLPFFSYILYLLVLIPPPFKQKNFTASMEMAELMIARFDTKNPTFGRSFFLLASFLSFLLVNFFLKILSAEAVIIYLFTFAEFASNFTMQKRT